MAGRKNEIMGGLKEGLGKLTGDDALEAEGSAQQDMGEAQRKGSGAMHEVKGSIKKGAGELMGSPTLEAEGEAEKAGGRVERA